MMNIVTHNLLAMNANRQFGIVNKKKAKSTEKLSSGYTINRAADDAAGLSISEKMRRQIRGLHKAEENIQDGISLCQVADGALNEVHDILQRMNELSVKAGNDTNSQTDRAFIQTEIDALTEEINRIANQTTFNEEIYPLLGRSASINDSSAVSGIIKVDEKGNKWVLPPQLIEYNLPFTVRNGNGTITIDGVEYSSYQSGEIKATGFVCQTNLNRHIMWLDEKLVSDTTDGLSRGLYVDPYPEGQIVGGNRLYSLSMSDLKVNENGHVYYYSKKRDQKEFLYVLLDENHNPWNMQGHGASLEQNYDGKDIVIAAGTPNEIVYGYVTAERYHVSGQSAGSAGGNEGHNGNQSDIWIHMSTEPGIGMFIDLVNASAKGIGIENLDMSSMENAGKAINSIKGALEKVSRYRTVFGSQQNRLEHAMNINANITENTTDAESRIRDTDVAKEVTEFSNENILAQAGQSMLAQANQNQQYILSLLS